MQIIIAIFLISIATAFTMLYLRMRSIKKGSIDIYENMYSIDLQFRHIEKYMLFYTKNVLQYMVLGIARVWFVLSNKIQNQIEDKWPKIHKYFYKEPEVGSPRKISFIHKAVLESKAKIQKMKEKINREN